MFVLLACFAAQQSYGQVKGFLIQRDSVYTEGFIEFNPRKPSEVKFSPYKRELATYTTADATAFGFRGSTTYVAKTVTLKGEKQKLFMEMFGDSIIYYLQRNRLFFSDRDTLLQLNKTNLLPYLQSQVSPEDKWYKELHLFKLKPGSLRYFAQNQKAVISPTVLFLRGGIFTGLHNSVLTSDYFPYFHTMPDELRMTSANASIGVFADVPVWSLINVSVYTPISYGLMRFNETFLLNSHSQNNARYDVKLNLDFVRFSVMPKYTLSYSRLRAFAFAGPSGTYFLKNESKMLETLQEGNNVWITRKDGLPVNKPFSIGYEAGAGIGYFILPKHLLSVSFSHGRNYSKSFDISNRSVTVSVNL